MASSTSPSSRWTSKPCARTSHRTTVAWRSRHFCSPVKDAPRAAFGAAFPARAAHPVTRNPAHSRRAQLQIATLGLWHGRCNDAPGTCREVRSPNPSSSTRSSKRRCKCERLIGETPLGWRCPNRRLVPSVLRMMAVRCTRRMTSPRVGRCRPSGHWSTELGSTERARRRRMKSEPHRLWFTPSVRQNCALRVNTAPIRTSPDRARKRAFGLDARRCPAGLASEAIVR